MSSAKAKPTYGALSSLVAVLLRQWLDSGCVLPDDFNPSAADETPLIPPENL